MSRFQTIDDVWGFLNNIPMFGVTGAKAANFELSNIQNFCRLLGNPQDAFKSIHIAGTNGKGTTAGLLESVYRTAGFKTGMFTSPHLEVYNERVQISGENISDELILRFFQRAEPFIEQIPLTYFEWSTALAFWAFAEEKVEIAIIETGLGGRLDSTNIIIPEISVITSIGMDHEAILGNTLASIAREKAGIIKTKKPVAIGDLDVESLNVMQEVALASESVVLKAEELAPEFDQGVITINQNQIFHTSFAEPINRWNVAMVVQTVKTLQPIFEVSEEELKEGIEVFQGLPGRFEKLGSDKNWYFSGAHNKQAIDATLEAIQAYDLKPDAIVLSFMSDKVKQEILELFRGFERVYFYQQPGERAAKTSDVTTYLDAKEITDLSYLPILKELRSQVVIFAGSFYFYPIVKQWLKQID